MFLPGEKVGANAVGTWARRYMLSHAKRQRDERGKFALVTSVVFPGLRSRGAASTNDLPPLASRSKFSPAKTIRQQRKAPYTTARFRVAITRGALTSNSTKAEHRPPSWVSPSYSQ